MAGCFGNNPYDRWLEQQADEYWGDDEEKSEGDPDTAPGGHDDY
jgi:hypothetical protein